VRRLLIAVVAVLVTVILQVTLINRLPLPRGAVPSLVLVLVAAMSTFEGPLAGTVIGFSAGLALDIAPPGGYLVGEYALVFCVTGFACGRLGEMVEGQALPTVLVAAAGAAAGEAASAVLGVMVSDPEVTWAAIKHVLPLSIGYDVLLTPFACGLVSVLHSGRATDGTLSAREPVYAPRMFGAAPSGLRLAGQSVPRLGLAGMTSPLVKPQQRRTEPRLKLAGITSSAIQPRAPRREAKVHFSSPGRQPAAPRRREPRFRRWGVAGRWSEARRRRGVRRPLAPRQFGGGRWGVRPPRKALHQAKPAKGWLAPGKAPKKRTRRSPGKGWLTSKPARRMGRNRYASKNWVRSSRRRRVLSRLGGRR
jgi:rod shape-determining protein MreD